MCRFVCTRGQIQKQRIYDFNDAGCYHCKRHCVDYGSTEFGEGIIVDIVSLIRKITIQEEIIISLICIDFIYASFVNSIPRFGFFFVVTCWMLFVELLFMIFMLIPMPVLPVQSSPAVSIIFGIGFLLFFACAIYQFYIWRVAQDKLVCYGVEEPSAIALVRRHGQDIPYWMLACAWRASGGNWEQFRPLRDQILDPFFHTPESPV
jgi:hypothetical protein